MIKRLFGNKQLKTKDANNKEKWKATFKVNDLGKPSSAKSDVFLHIV